MTKQLEEDQSATKALKREQNKRLGKNFHNQKRNQKTKKDSNCNC